MDPSDDQNETQELILVDDQDQEIGTASREQCHAGAGLQHRAFSVLLFDGAGHLLLQRRSMAKSLWPGFWSNSCCSHPRRGEEILETARRRVGEELGLGAELRFVFKFGYFAQYSPEGSERELCSVFFGRLVGEVRPNPEEVLETRLEAVTSLGAKMDQSPETFTPWFRLAWERILSEHVPVLREFAG